MNFTPLYYGGRVFHSWIHLFQEEVIPPHTTHIAELVHGEEAKEEVVHTHTEEVLHTYTRLTPHALQKSRCMQRRWWHAEEELVHTEEVLELVHAECRGGDERRQGGGAEEVVQITGHSVPIL